MELLEEEEILMSPKQVSSLLNLVNKEETLEMEDKVVKTLAQQVSNRPKQAKASYITAPLAGGQEVYAEQFPVTQRNGNTLPDMSVQPLDAATVEDLLASSKKAEEQHHRSTELEEERQPPVRARLGSKSGRD